MNKTLESRDFFPTIEDSILYAGVKTFRTKRDALSIGKQFGWNRAVKVARRFETVWIIGAIDFQNSYENGIAFQTLKIPMLKYEHEKQTILILRNHIQE
jgi:hypothetical protein